MSDGDFDPVEFNKLAQDLLGNLSGAPVASSGPNQSKIRTAIGRCYYATFLVAREKLSNLGRITPTGRPLDHKIVVDALGGEASDLGGKLYRLRVKRNKADYNLNPSGFRLQAGQHWLKITSYLISKVNNLS